MKAIKVLKQLGHSVLSKNDRMLFVFLLTRGDTRSEVMLEVGPVRNVHEEVWLSNSKQY